MDPSMQSRARQYLEIATNVAVLLVAMVVLATIASNLLAPSVSLEGGLRKGGAFPQLPGVDYGKSSKTLLTSLSVRCDYCSESLPFLKEVARIHADAANAVRIIAVFADPESEVKRYIDQRQLNFPAVSGADLKTLNLSATPTYVLVDSNGRIVDFWIGKPSTDVEQQIVKAITST